MNVHIAVALLILWNISFCAKPRDIKKKLTLLENQLSVVERRLDLFESKQDFDNDAISKNTERITIIESHLNDTEIVSRTVVNEGGRKQDLPSTDASLGLPASVEVDIERILEAFYEEKILNERLREDISVLKNALTGLNEEVTQMKDEQQSIRRASSTAEELRERSDGVFSSMITNFDMLNSSVDYLTLQMNGVEKTAEMAFNICQKVENQQGSTKVKLASCKELYDRKNIRSGVYTVYPGDQKLPVRVFCDMETDGGGWTVFQRRIDGSEDFFRGWEDYKWGFGDLDGEFWLGNDHLSEMTAECCNELRIDLEDFEGNRAYAKYGKFQVLSKVYDYKLVAEDYSGDAGDSLKTHSGRRFSTKDRDLDSASTNCADSYKGGWWYSNCHDSNLNGLYLHGTNNQPGKGIIWYHWKMTNKYSLKTTEMKVRKL